jgi:hypothetical protein
MENGRRYGRPLRVYLGKGFNNGRLFRLSNEILVPPGRYTARCSAVLIVGLVGRRYLNRLLLLLLLPLMAYELQFG